MKKYTAVLAALAAIMLTLGLSQSALANNLSGSTTLYGTPGHFTVSSTATLQTGGTYNNDYKYDYQFNAVPGGQGLISLTVYFYNLGNVDLTTGYGGGSTGGYLNGGVNWTFNNPGILSGEVWFYSPISPGFGGITAQDGGTWNSGSGNAPAYGIVVPGVPDGGLTVALLGGALVGLQVLRRKLVG